MPAPSTSVAMVRERIENADSARLEELLEEGHSVYDQQTTQDVSEIRVLILLALASRPLSDAALRAVLEELESGHDPHLVAAAAMALRAYPRPTRAFDSYVQRAQENMRALDDLISFETLEPDPKVHSCTTPLRELQRTAEWLQENGVAADCCPLPPILNRFTLTPSIDNLMLEDQNGVTATFRKLFTGHPSIVAFFYTRCDNPLKCSLTGWKLARLQKALEARGVGTAVHTAAITYDSEFDTPERLRRFALNRDLRLDENHSVFRVQGGIDPLRAHFRLGVNFFEGLVNRHRIELFVLDREGNVATSYQRLQWDEQEVCDKAVALLTQSRKPRAISVAGPAAALGAAILPKCPFCWAAWLSAAGVTSINGATVSTSAQIALLALLVLNLGAVFWRSRATGRKTPIVIALVAAGCLAGGAPYLGAVLLMLSAVFSSFPRRELPSSAGGGESA